MKDFFISRKHTIIFCALILATCSTLTLRSQLSPQEAGYIDAVADFGAKNDGVSITTTSLQAALDAAISQDKGLYLPPGEYLIDGTIFATDNPAKRADQTIVIQGYSLDPNQRSTLVLKEGTFPDPDNPGTMLISTRYDPNGQGGGYADVIDRNIQSIDFKIQGNNAGARGLDWRGAEGSSVFDVHMDMTGGLSGFIQLLGSGGSVANISVIGGQFGVSLKQPNGNGSGTQPSPTITAARFEGQTGAAILSAWNRGTITLTGFEIKLAPGVPAFRIESRHQTWRFSYGGNYALTDCSIEYSQPDPENSIIRVDTFYRALDSSTTVSELWPTSHYWNNVYLKNAAFVNIQAYPRNAKNINQNTADDYSVIPSNPTGWRYFSEMALSSGPRSQPNGSQYEPIYFDGIRQDDVYQNFQNNKVPTINFADYHSWGNTFPSFNSPGAVNLQDFTPIDGDWAPALQAAIDAAASTSSGVVFVPTGKYFMYGGVTMKQNTKIIGVANHLSLLLALDKPGKRYANSAIDPYDTPTPIIQSAIGSNDNILADIAVSSLGSFGVHDPTPNSKMSVLWRAGSKSVVRNILYRRQSDGEPFRPSNVLIGTLINDEWLKLRTIPTPSNIGGFTFTSDSETKFFQLSEPYEPFFTLPKILLETVNGSQRLLTRSIPFNNKADIDFTQSNLEIKKDNGGTFTLNSLEVFNGAWNPKGGGDIKIEVFKGSSKQTFTVNIEGLNKPREQAQFVNINQNNVSRVLITSEHQFAVDNLKVNGTTLDFEAINGDLPVRSRFIRNDDGIVTDTVIGDIADAIYYDAYRDLPLSYLNHTMVKITGGVKWYNHWLHGDVWMDPHLPYISVENNTDEVNFYHFHAQHSQNDIKLLLEGASNVSAYGFKVEQAGLVVKAVNSNNFRIVGHGGLTTSVPGNPMFRFENCSDFLIVSPTDELDNNPICQFCNRGNAILPQATYGTYKVIADINGGTFKTHDPFERPLLWKNGNYTNPLDNSTPDPVSNELVLEAECGIIGANWIEGQEAGGVTFVEITPGLNSTNTPPTSTDDKLQYSFDLPEAGTNYLFLLTSGNNAGEDSYWIRINNGNWINVNNLPASGNFEWAIARDSNNGDNIVELSLSAGTNSLEIAYREDGAKLDKMIVSTSTDLPSLFGPSISCGPATYTITSSAGADGSISPQGETTVNEGDDLSFTISANSGYEIADVLVDGSSVGALTSYTFSNIQTDHTISATFSLIPINPPNPNDNEILLEAECGIVGSNWITNQEVGGITFVEITPGLNSTTAPPTSADDKIQYSFSVSEAGTYYMFLLAKALNAGDDSFWLKIDNGSWLSVNNLNGPNNFEWNIVRASGANSSIVSFPLSAGIHSLEIAYREDGTKLDKIFVSPSTEIPTVSGSSVSCNPVDPPNPGSIELLLEAECGSLGANWITGQEGGGITFVEITPGLNSTKVTPTNPDDIIQYSFSLADGGVYYIFSLSKGFDAGEDSYYIKVDNGNWIEVNVLPATGNFEWEIVKDFNAGLSIVEFPLSSGVHTMEIAYREDGTKLDKFFISPSSTIPTTTGPSANCGTSNQLMISITEEESTDQKSRNTFSTLWAYPNPFSEGFTLDLRSLEEPTKIQVFGSNGQVLWSKILDADLHNINNEIIKNMASGIYFIQAISSNHQRMTRLIKIGQ